MAASYFDCTDEYKAYLDTHKEAREANFEALYYSKPVLNRGWFYLNEERGIWEPKPVNEYSYGANPWSNYSLYDVRKSPIPFVRTHSPFELVRTDSENQFIKTHSPFELIRADSENQFIRTHSENRFIRTDSPIEFVNHLRDEFSSQESVGSLEKERLTLMEEGFEEVPEQPTDWFQGPWYSELPELDLYHQSTRGCIWDDAA